MRSRKDVTQEIRRIVSDRIDAGVAVRVEWLATEIIAMKDSIEGEDADFYQACAVDFIKETVKRCVGDYAPKASTSTAAELLLPGFEHVQKAYTVQRENETILVPTDLLTDEEIEARALEYEAMARGCIAHAKELRAYQRGRIDVA